ncbi:hypothetical protein RclHR1_21200001, partial [Rhizophagus clarus]
VKQTFNFEGGLYSKKASVFDSRFEVRGWIPRRNIEDRISKFVFNFPFNETFANVAFFYRPEMLRNFKGLQLLNTTGLNFEDSASEHNFEGPRLPEHLIDRISEVCGFIVPHRRNFKDLWLFGCFLKDFKGI